MDLTTLSGQSAKIKIVIETIKNDPNFLSELKESPKEALSKIGLELNEEEIDILQKLEHIKELEEEAVGIFNRVKGLFGFKEEN